MLMTDKIGLIKDLFIERTDSYARQVGESYQRVQSPITDEVITDHLLSKQTISVYFGDKCKKIVIDIDIDKSQMQDENVWKELKLKVQKIKSVLVDLSITKEKILTEFSGRRGYHLWVFFDEPVKLLDAYNLRKIIEKKIDFEVEIFPKKFQCGKNGFNNPIKLPLGIHQASGKKSVFVNEESNELIEEENWKCLQQIQKITKEEVKIILKQHVDEILNIPDDFIIKEASPNKISVETDGLKYVLTNIKYIKNEIKAQVSVFNSEKLINKDNLLLTSNHRKKVFVNYCKQISNEEKEKIAEHFLYIEQIAKFVLKEKSNKGKSETEKKVVLTPDDIKEAEELAKNPKLLYEILQVIKVDVAGEEKNSLLLYLGGSSRKLDEPIAITVKGDSSAGKSYSSRKILALMPKEDVIELTDATPQSFYYLKKSIANKIIMITELNGMKKVEYPVRVLQSEKRIKIQVTVKNPLTGEFETKEKEVEGPVMFLITTTNPLIHDENETRCLSLYIDESKGQTKLIFEKTSNKYKQGIIKLKEEDIRKFINFQRILKPYKVIIPYIDVLEDMFPLEPVRVRRDYSRLLGIIEIIAVLHQYQRKTWEENSVSYLKANLSDYYYAKTIAEESLCKTIYGLPPKTIQIIEQVEELTDAFPEHEQIVTYKDLSLALHWNVPVVKKWLEPAEESGFLLKESSGKGRGKENRYRRTEKKLEEMVFLPSLEKIKDQYSELEGYQIFDLFSGEEVLIKMNPTIDTQETEENTTENNEDKTRCLDQEDIDDYKPTSLKKD